MPMPRPVYLLTTLEHCENAEEYRPGGFHPLMPEEAIGSGRYRILNKLGAGGGATVWLARDRTTATLVCLKVLRADHMLLHDKLAIEATVHQALLAASTGLRGRLLVLHRTFVEVGPNGAHTCVVTDVSGPNLGVLATDNGRLRADHARVVAQQVATFMRDMHAAGYVHGDLRSGNVLLRIDPTVSTWSDEKVLEAFDEPNTEELVRNDGQPRSAPDGAPAELVEPISSYAYLDAGIVRVDAVIIDFGQSFPVAAKPHNYEPATTRRCRAPEMHFDNTVTQATDVWAFGCLLFEIRAGMSLFGQSVSSSCSIPWQLVALLGKFPDPWWATWDERHRYFHENGEPVDGQSKRTSIRAQLRQIGTRDLAWLKVDKELFEAAGTRLAEEEVELLGDLLERMLRHRPEERITMDEVVGHPWFTYQ